MSSRAVGRRGQAVAQPSELATARRALKRQIRAAHKCADVLVNNAERLRTRDAVRLEQILADGPSATLGEWHRMQRNREEFERREAARHAKEDAELAVRQKDETSMAAWNQRTEEQVMADFIEMERYEDYKAFIMCLNYARQMWKLHRDLVEASEIPADIRATLEQYTQEWPLRDEVAFRDNPLSDGYEDRLADRARKDTAKEIAKRQSA